jgi:heme exporter protein D
MGARNCCRGGTLNFDTWGEFVAMGGHGFYVWLSYALSVIVVLGNVFATRSSRRRYLGEQRDQQLRDQQLRNDRTA